MRILLVGASGFIGESILKRLISEGHDVRACVRSPGIWRMKYPSVEWVQGDFSQDQDDSDWLSRVEDCDVVINAVGILHETRNQRFRDLHTLGPAALFRAAAKSGIRRVLQISALGADEKASTQYHLSKRAADELLTSLGGAPVILHPSIVIGEGARSTELFATLAALPIVLLPGGGAQKLQPVSIDDLTKGIARLLRNWPKDGGRFDVVGPHPVTLSQLIQQMALEPPVLSLNVPVWLMRLGSHLNFLPGMGMLDREALEMLERGSCGDPAPFENVTGLKMQSVEAFLSRDVIGAMGRLLLLSLLMPALRISIAFLWIWTGIVSAFLYPVNGSLSLLSSVGFTGIGATVLLYLASFIDALLGAALFLPLRSRAFVYLSQFLLVGFYTLILSPAMPELWLHPFGPLSKNIPLLAATLIGFLFDRGPLHES